ncbi:MAG: hypothetical protein ABSH41_29810 [Syntrophobacteraceae bacterium]|jgi:DNA-binding NtrC family response regulator
MAKRIAVVQGNNEEREDLCAELREHLFQVASFPSLADFEQGERNFAVVIFDLNSLPVTNQLLQEYSKTMPGLYMIAVSSRTFHPELREAMTTCLTACLTKPVDLNELVYLLKGILMENSRSNCSNV